MTRHFRPDAPYKNTGAPFTPDRFGEFVLYATLDAMADASAAPPLVSGWVGELTPPHVDALVARLKALGLRTIAEQRLCRATADTPGRRSANYILMYRSHDAYIDITCRTSRTEIQFAATDAALFDAVSTTVTEVVSATGSSEGRAYAITSSDNGPALTQIGRVGVPFEPGNYAPDIVDRFHHLVSALSSPTPPGRLTILDGPPGTGKTYLLRALMQALPSSVFVVIPPGMTTSLSSPQLLPVLLDGVERRSSTRHWFTSDALIDDDSSAEPLARLVLVIEDADDALVPRDAGNLGQISALLNLSDGIIGHSLDLQIVATTNATLDDIDPALTRAGRLLAHVHVGLLSIEQAAQTLARLNPDADPARLRVQHYDLVPGFNTTHATAGVALADVYDLAAQ